LDVNEVRKLDAYLKRLFSNPRLRVVPRPQRADTAEIFGGDEFLGVLTLDDEDEDRSYNFRMEIPLGSNAKEDVQRLNAYLREKLGSAKIRVVPRARKSDSLEAYVDAEFVGVLFIDEAKNARSCILEMAILDLDLEQDGAAPSL
jgi:Protein of unknown function (DUF3126)